jgi:hypothetical protein
MIPEQYKIICKGCGKTLDMRDVSVLSHGWIEDVKIVCFDEVDLPYSSSKKVGESTLWTKDKKPIELN